MKVNRWIGAYWMSSPVCYITSMCTLFSTHNDNFLWLSLIALEWTTIYTKKVQFALTWFCAGYAGYIHIRAKPGKLNVRLKHWEVFIVPLGVNFDLILYYDRFLCSKSLWNLIGKSRCLGSFCCTLARIIGNPFIESGISHAKSALCWAPFPVVVSYHC